MIVHCPACQRKLISHISPRCNWCGHEIQDSSYQEEAEIRRQAHAMEQAQHDAQSRQWFQNSIDAYAAGGLGMNVPIGPMRRPRMDMSQDVQQRMAAEAAIIAEAARMQQMREEAAARAEEERKAREEAEAQKKTADGRFNHLEL
ncbi:hypothetical protein CCAX7_47410 [Capsulimonas corticalis]|uniref:Uncharacterized protein n=1 Tax=Capsulimonas corticalis TaxID=2219043 RepID=A0A402CQL3_9BACT|nr:hypothetical protein [Capsulimonas corticalis]BDI32690.1 hypothetical protein CCAX7_47410 [Capsulimonas corticalis]